MSVLPSTGPGSQGHYVLEALGGFDTYPVKPIGIFPYDNASVTLPAGVLTTEAFAARGAILRRLVILGGAAGNMNVRNIKNNAIILAFPVDPAARPTPTVIDFGPRGLYLPHGFGLRTTVSGPFFQVYYDLIPKNPL